MKPFVSRQLLTAAILSLYLDASWPLQASYESHEVLSCAADVLSLSTEEFSSKDIQLILQHPDISFVYIPEKVVSILLKIESSIEEVEWKSSIESVFSHLHGDYQIAPAEAMNDTMITAFALLKSETANLQNADVQANLQTLRQYQKDLTSKEALVVVIESESEALERSEIPHTKTKKIHCPLCVRNFISTKNLLVCQNATIQGDLTVGGTIYGGGISGATGPTGPAGSPGATGATGPTGTFSGIVADNNFTIVDATDATKQLKFDVQGATSTVSTVVTNPTVNRTYTTPDIDGTLLVSQTGTEFVFIGGPTAALHASNAGIQYSTIVANRAQIRENQYGNNAGVAGITAFKSRGATIGSLAPVQAGDVLYRATAIGVTDNLSIPIGGLISIVVPPGGVPAGQGWVATDYEIQLVPLAGPANGRKQAFRITSEGILHIQEAANKMAGVAVTDGTGSVTVANTQITATSRITLTIQDGGTVPTGFVYVSGRVVGTNFTITSSTADVGVPVYYQIWEPTAP